jgi:hypothetical protein
MPEVRRPTPAIGSQGLTRLCIAATVLFGVLCMPRLALCQSDKWQVDVAPLYLWASETNGNLSVRDRSVPIFLDFSDAADSLAGAFAFHGEARKNRLGIFSDINFIRLSTDASFTTPILSRSVDGTAQLDMTMFEAGGSYLVRPESNLSVIGGLRTYTLSPKLEFESDVRELTVVDTSKTAVGVFGGVSFRPKLSEKWNLLTRADIGAGEAFTWSATVGLAYRIKPWAGLMFGYHALGVDTGDAGEDSNEVEYDVTHYGPMFSLTLHWTQK